MGSAMSKTIDAVRILMAMILHSQSMVWYRRATVQKFAVGSSRAEIDREAYPTIGLNITLKERYRISLSMNIIKHYGARFSHGLALMHTWSADGYRNRRL